MSVTVTVSADGKSATTADATLSDAATTIFSSNQAVTGLYGFLQKALLVSAGMAISNYRHSGSVTNFG